LRRPASPDARGGRRTFALAAAAGVVSLAVRYVYSSGRALNGDEAVQGLLALRLLHGHAPGLLWPSQSYGGTLEVPFQAALEALRPGSVVLLRAPLMAASSLAVALFVIFVRRVTGSLAAAAAAGATAAVAPAEFVDLGGWMSAGYNLSLLLAVAAAVSLAGGGRPHRGRLAAASVLTALATYEQPVSLLLVAPLLFVVHRACRRITAGQALTLAAPAAAVLLALSVYDRVAAANGSIFPRIDGGHYSLLAKLGAVLGAEHTVTLDGPMTWFAAGLDGYSSTAATVLSLLAWTAVGVVALAGRLPGRRARRLKAAPLVQTWAISCCIAAALAVAASFVLFPLGRFAFAASLLLALGVAALVSAGGPGAERRPLAVLLLVVLSVHAARLLGDRPREPDVDSARSAVAQLLESRRRPVVGSYWDVYPLDFLSADELRVFPTFFNRFPRAVEALPAGAVVTGSWIASPAAGPLGTAPVMTSLGCRFPTPPKPLEGGLSSYVVGVVRCPKRALGAATPQALRQETASDRGAGAAVSSR
jgi:hypothetical protein